MAANLKVALVTGSNKGIGRAIVEILSQQLKKSEWAVYLTARNSDLGKQAICELEKKGISVRFHQLDIDVESSRRALKEFLVREHGGLDVLVNNAGMAYTADSTVPFAEQAEVTVRTNFFSTLRMCQEFIPILKQDARLVIVSSMVTHMTLKRLGEKMYECFMSPMTMDELEETMQGFVASAKENTLKQLGWPEFAYGVSKLGVTKMTYILAEALRNDPRKIIINCCCPGYVDTDLSSHKGHLTVYQGADTPVYLATLPVGTTSPYGEFVSERKVVEWK